MTQKLNESKNQKENAISKWEHLVELHQKAKNDSSLRQWGKFSFEMLKFTGLVIVKLIIKKVIQHFFADFWSDIFGNW